MRNPTPLALALLCILGVSQALAPLWASLRIEADASASARGIHGLSSALVQQVVIRPGDGDDTTLHDTTISRWSPETVHTVSPTHTLKPSPTVSARGGIQGLVFEDRNENGQVDEGEPGLAGALIILKDSGGRQIDSRTTTTEGGFVFASLLPGTYRVEQYDLPGTYSTTPNLIYIPVQAGDLLWVSFGDRYTSTITPTVPATSSIMSSYLPLWSKNLSLPLAEPTATPRPSFVPYSQAINCGASTGYQASDDFWYAPDQLYTQGSWGWEGPLSQTWTASLDVQGTGDDPLYHSQRHTMDAYRFDVPVGDYEVLLCFAEILQYVKTGDRIFAVDIEERRVLDKFDMVARGARNRALEQVFRVTVSDGVLDIVFVPQSVEYSPAINAIRVQRMRTQP